MFDSTFTYTVTPPFRLDLTVWVLRRRQKNATDLWEDQTYTRILALGDTPIKLAVLPCEERV